MSDLSDETQQRVLALRKLAAVLLLSSLSFFVLAYFVWEAWGWPAHFLAFAGWFVFPDFALLRICILGAKALAPEEISKAARQGGPVRPGLSWITITMFAVFLSYLLGSLSQEMMREPSWFLFSMLLLTGVFLLICAIAARDKIRWSGSRAQ